MKLRPKPKHKTAHCQTAAAR